MIRRSLMVSGMEKTCALYLGSTISMPIILLAFAAYQVTLQAMR
jgi:hypothetical protein